MFKNLILLPFFPFYPDNFFGPLLFLVLIFSMVLFFWKREKIILKLFSLSYIFSFLGLCLTTFFVKFQTLGTNPVFRDQFIDAKGFPLAVLTYDAGMTDPNFHPVVLVMNLVFYFIIFTTLLLVIFRKKLKKIIPMSKKIFLPVVLAVVLLAGLVILRFSTPEDTWICSNGAWTRHGNPSASMPTNTCPGVATNESQNKPISLANPASVNCTDKGGTLVIEKRSDGGEFGVCYFEDNRQCEEWALMRGDCPVGGRKVTGYVTAAGRYCVIGGGEYIITTPGDENTERGNCVFHNGSVCDAQNYYIGNCPMLE